MKFATLLTPSSVYEQNSILKESTIGLNDPEGNEIHV